MRKKCKYCDGKLETRMQRLLGICSMCAQRTRDIIKNTLKDKDAVKKIEKKLRKKGLSEEEIKEGLKKAGLVSQ